MSERRTAPHLTHLAAALAALAIGPALGCVQKLPPTPASPTAAVVGHRTITLDEVDGVLKDTLFERTFPPGDTARLFEARQSALDQIVAEEVVSQAAHGSKLSAEDWLSQEAERRTPVTDADIEAFWKEYEHRIPKDLSEEQTRDDIRSYLHEERTKALVEDLRSEAGVRIVLARPRFDVEPRGTARGPADAPVVIVEFSDFECPYCLRVTPTIQSLLDEYPEQVRLYYRHLPLPNHKRARAAATAAVCAERQGEFWEYHDVLFENQRALGDADLRGYAEQIGLDLDHFDACLTSPEAAARIDEDLAAASALGVSGTPAFFVNGLPLKGAQPIAQFQRLINEELAAIRANPDTETNRGAETATP